MPFHCSAQEDTIQGYTIPKHTWMFINTYSVHMNPKHWDKPREFRPERFLDEQGKVTRPDCFLAFGLGKLSRSRVQFASYTALV